MRGREGRGRSEEESDAGTVGAADLEHRLAGVAAEAAGPAAGILGPASVTWQIDREAVIFLGAGRALLLQLAHPWVAAAIAEHSRSLEDPIGRFHRTFGIIFPMVFGSCDQALAAARRLHRRHTAITGRLPRAVGRFAAGTPYRANNAAALSWVHATLAETALLAHDLVLAPLAPEARERYWSEHRRFAGLFGIPEEMLPCDWSGFAAYSAAMQQGDTLAVGAEARRTAAALLGGRLSPPFWYRAVTASLLTPRWREEFGLPYGAAEQRVAGRALGLIRRLIPWLPPLVRFVGPYREACARLQGRRPGPLTTLSNRLWIGHARMAE
ncbi:MAG: oxygenase MpaB family protein [Stellaceae bacterium]